VPLPVCRVCGQAVKAPGLCWNCRREPLTIDGVRSVFVFEAGVREAVHQLKYRNRPSLVAVLAGLMAGRWLEEPMPADVLVAVPLHPARQRERGYNQAELLARALGERVGLPVSAGGLRRVRHTPPQMTLDARERRTNVQGAFAYVAPHPDAAGRRVLLVDDVCTTGSTLEACSVALKGAGAASVWAFTLARAIHRAGEP
jgi:ComF family protein